MFLVLNSTSTELMPSHCWRTTKKKTRHHPPGSRLVLRAVQSELQVDFKLALATNTAAYSIQTQMVKRRRDVAYGMGAKKIKIQ